MLPQGGYPLNYKSRQCGIYCIVNATNGKFYIGSSIHCYRRVMSNHLKKLRRGEHNNPHLQSSWNKHGEGSFAYYIIEFCSHEKLLEREQFYIDSTKCLDPIVGYNINIFADRTVLTADQRKKISISKIGHVVSAETRIKISAANRLRKWSPQQRNKFIASNTGKKRSLESRQRFRDAWVKRKDVFYTKHI